LVELDIFTSDEAVVTIDVWKTWLITACRQLVNPDPRVDYTENLLVGIADRVG